MVSPPSLHFALRDVSKRDAHLLNDSVFLILIQMQCCKYELDGFMRITLISDYVAVMSGSSEIEQANLQKLRAIKHFR